jgi:nucleoside 2-deoxyribosyltransferase
VKIYLAGPLFTTAERDWNDGLGVRLKAAGHEIYLSQEHPASEPTGQAIFQKDVKALDGADILVANMDGPDPDAGTAWECGYTYARGKPIVLYRTDVREPGDAPDIPYNAMLIGAADAHLELPLATLDDAARAILATLGTLPPRKDRR